MVDTDGTRVGLRPGDNRALLSVATQFFVNGLVFASFIPRLPEIRDRIDISVGTLGILLALAGVAGLGGSATVGIVIDRFGTRIVMVGAAIALVVSLSIVGLATGPLVLLVALVGLATFDVWVDSAMNLQGSWLSGRRRVPVMNRLHGLWSLGTVVGGIAASQLAAAGVSLRVHLFVVAGLMACVVVFVGAGLLRTDEGGEAPGHDLNSHDLNSDVLNSDVLNRSGSRGRRVSRRPLVLLALAGGCSIMMEVTSSDWAAFRLSDDFAAGAGVAGMAYVAFTAGMTTGRFGGDWLFGRFGQQRVADVAIVVTLGALSAASFAPNRIVVIGAYVIAGLSIATQFPKLYDDAAKYPGKRGAGLGALTGGSKVALLVTPAAVGALADSSLSIGVSTAVLAIPAALGFATLSRR